MGIVALALPLFSLTGRDTPRTMVAKAASPPPPSVDDSTPPPVDFEKIKPNESGMVPILMYHNIIGDKIVEMKYPVAMFRSDLQWLYDHNYRPISLTDFVQGKIDCPVGMSPVILTFDDGDKSQFNYLANGQIDPDCAVAIMDKFHADHPDWPTRATFFLIAGSTNLPAPFYQKKYVKRKIAYLLSEGYDLGNHTVHHPRMNRLSDDDVQAEIAGCVANLHKYAPDYDVDTIALPYGIFPKNATLLPSGSYDSIDYHNVCAMAAGWRPADSPIDKSFHRYELERIQAGNAHFQSHWWLDYLEAHPGKKFVSDGDPSVFTVPADLAKRVDKHSLYSMGFEMRTYGETSHLASTKTKSGVAKNAVDEKKSTAKSAKSADGLTLVKTGGYTPAHN